MAITTALLVTALASAPGGAAAATAQVIPTVYEVGHFYAVLETTDGQRLRLLVDTGGGGGNGLYWISRAAASRLHLRTTSCAEKDGQKGHLHLPVAPLPDYRAGHALPPPGDSPCGAVVLVFAQSGANFDDGQLGAGYLPGRVWTFDYPAQRLSLERKDWQPAPDAHRALLGFPHDASGKPDSGFPRITIRVDGQPLDMLLDTGATAHPTIEGQRISGTSTINGYGVTSYITSSMFGRWHKAHPDWRVVDNGDDLLGSDHATRMIEVPKVEIAGWSVGPTWFTERPDHNFHDVMSSMMDKQVEGSVGANVFQHFVMTLDYPHETAWLRCANGCKAVATPPPGP